MIVGAGLSGLVCARILQRARVPVTVLEADASEWSRQQGGSLDIHRRTGQAALRDAGVLDDFLEKVHAGGEATRVMDKRARVLVDEEEPEGGNGRPEIDRRALRHLLVDSLAPGTIEWGTRVVGVELQDGRPVVMLSDRRVSTDVMVGADGAWSTVRRAVTPVRPAYSGITIVEVRLPNAAELHSEASAMAGLGTFFALSDGKSISGHGGEEIVVGLGLRVPEDWAVRNDVNGREPADVRRLLLDHYRDWAAPLTDLIRHCDDAIWARPIYALPIGQGWEHRPGITLVGDAAHLMSPFAGEGANLALADGADLARAIIDGTDLDRVVRRHETKLRRRARRAAKASARGLDMMFEDDSPRRIVRFFTRGRVLSTIVGSFSKQWT